MAEGGIDPLRSAAPRDGANLSLPLDEAESGRLLRGNTSEEELGSFQRETLLYERSTYGITAPEMSTCGNTPPERSTKIADSFYHRVSPPDGHSRMREFQNVSQDDLSLKSFADPDTIDAGPVEPDAECSIGVWPDGRPYYNDQTASDAVCSVIKSRALTSQRSYSFGDECTKHNENIKYICLSCNDALLCQVCLSLKHSQCEKYEFINDVVKDPTFGFENKCATFEKELRNVDQRIKSNKSKLNTNTKICAYMKQNAMVDFKNHRVRLNKLFDQLEKDFERKISKIEMDDNTKIGSLCSEVVRLENEFNELSKDFLNRKVEGKRSRVFTKIQWSHETIDTLNEKLAQVESENEVFKYRYKPSEIMDKLFLDGVEIAEANEIDYQRKSDITSVSNIDVTHANDSKQCKITGLAFLSEKCLIAVDTNNSAIKIVDTERERLEEVHAMASQPLDVAVMPNGQTTDPLVIVTFPKDCKIGFFDRNIAKVNEIKTNGICRSVMHSDGKLIVSFPKQGKIEIITTSGTLVARITNETIGQPVFEPQFVAIDMSRSRLYVTDKETHGILVLDNDGAVQNLYTNVDMVEPRGICVNKTGSVFACSMSGHTIHHLSDTGEFISALNVKDEVQLMPSPHSIIYCNNRNVLYVGQLSYGCIKAYKIAM